MIETRIRRGAGHVLAAGAAVLPPLAVLAPLGLAPLLAVIAVAIVVVDGRAAIAAARPLLPLALLWAALAGWGLLSALWSILPLFTLLDGLRVGAIGAAGVLVFGAALALEGGARRTVAIALAWGVGVAIALLLFERSTGAALSRFILGRSFVPLVRFDRGVTTLTLAVWPVVAAATGRRWLVLVALAVAGVVTVLSMYSSAGALAVTAATVALGVAWFLPRPVAVALAGSLVLTAVALPLFIPTDRAIVTLHHDAPWIKFSGIHRLMIWRFTADRVAERPLLGWGMGASRAMPGGKTDLYALYPQAGIVPGSTALPLHPHNAALEWQVELGLPGSLLGLAIVSWGLWRAGAGPPLSRLARAAALAWATAALIIALLSYGIWQPWWLSCLWLTAGLIAAVTVPAEEMRRDSADSPARDRP